MAKKDKNRNVEEQVHTPVEECIEFEAWWATRENQIPKQHHREIVRADFDGQGLGDMATIKEFDDALGKYGIKLA